MGRVFKPRRKKSDGQTWTSPKWYVEFREAGGAQKRIPASTSKTEAIGLLRELEGRERRRTFSLSLIVFLNSLVPNFKTSSFVKLGTLFPTTLSNLCLNSPYF